MPRQPYSVAVLSTGGRLHPRFLRKRGLGRKWSSLWLKGDGGIRKKTPHLFSDEEHYLEMEVDFLQPFLDIEARTALANPGKVAMT